MLVLAVAGVLLATAAASVVFGGPSDATPHGRLLGALDEVAEAQEAHYHETGRFGSGSHDLEVRTGRDIELTRLRGDHQGWEGRGSGVGRGPDLHPVRTSGGGASGSERVHLLHRGEVGDGTIRVRRSSRVPSLLLGLLLGAPAPLWSQAADPVATLLARGRLQEAAWAARAAGDTARADSVLDRLAVLLRAAPRAARPQSVDSQGVSYTYRLDHGQGVQSIFKVDGSDIFCRGCGADREVAAYRVDRLLGIDLTPMTVEARIVDASGDTLVGSAMYFVDGASSPQEAGAMKPDLLRFFDAVIGNSDRHKSNWLVLPDGRAVAIDHNRSFRYRPALPPKTCWETEIDSIAHPAALGPALDRFRALPGDALAGAVAVLDPELAADFVAMRDRVLARIDARIRDPRRQLSYTDCFFRP